MLLILLHAVPVAGCCQGNVVAHLPVDWQFHGDLGVSCICGGSQMGPCDVHVRAVEVKSSVSHTDDLAAKDGHLCTSGVAVHCDDGL